MLVNTKLKRVNELVADLSREEIIWLHGYLAGLITTSSPQTATGLSGGEANHLTPSTINSLVKDFAPLQNEVLNESHPNMGRGTLAGVGVPRFTLAYGTETGNAKRLATALATVAKKKGAQVKLVALDQYRLADLPKEEKFGVVISTQGEGEPPVGAQKFYDHLFSSKPSLPRMQYAVLALGDTAYPLFCKAGEDVDSQLQRLGAKPLLPVRKCDVDFEADAAQWFEELWPLLAPAPAAEPATAQQPAPLKTQTKTIYKGTILANINLNARGSNKSTYHIEIGAEGVVYESGDALGVVPENRKEVVDEIIRLAGVEGSEWVHTEKHEGTIRDLLTSHLNICYLLGSTVKAYAALTGHEIPDTRMDLKDLLRIYPLKTSEQFVAVVQLLKAIPPRLYSIASAPAAHPGEVHLTVARNSFLLQDEQHFGLCSEFLGDLPVGAPLHFYIHKNRSFRLPAPEKDIIMIGPGTGIAPFRSFIAERDATGASGRSWLFFGNQHFTTDFSYQTELQAWFSTGALTKINLAFSRDQPEKVYVQHKMQEHAAELFQWLEGGAHLYISGTKHPMSGDVEGALLQIIQQQKGGTAGEAMAYLNALKDAGRYEKDVY